MHAAPELPQAVSALPPRQVPLVSQHPLQLLQLPGFVVPHAPKPAPTTSPMMSATARRSRMNFSFGPLSHR
jgi:hypothetical protein